jgi:broad specificity phosphatase PhoE
MDLELNETGRQQAVMVAHRLSKEAKPATVYSSDLKRTAETARTIATACDVSNVRIILFTIFHRLVCPSPDGMLQFVSGRVGSSTTRKAHGRSPRFEVR